MGQAKVREARRQFVECERSGVWPGYSTSIKPLEPPTWAIYQHEEQYG